MVNVEGNPGNPTSSTAPAPAATAHIRAGRGTRGNRIARNARTPTMIPSACPDGNDEDAAAVSAVSGRGRSTAALAATVTSPIASTVSVRNTAIRGCLFSRATTMPMIAMIRRTVGPSSIETAFQNSIQAGRCAPKA